MSGPVRLSPPGGWPRSGSTRCRPLGLPPPVLVGGPRLRRVSSAWVRLNVGSIGSGAAARARARLATVVTGSGSVGAARCRAPAAGAAEGCRVNPDEEGSHSSPGENSGKRFTGRTTTPCRRTTLRRTRPAPGDRGGVELFLPSRSRGVSNVDQGLRLLRWPVIGSATDTVRDGPRGVLGCLRAADRRWPGLGSGCGAAVAKVVCRVSRTVSMGSRRRNLAGAPGWVSGCGRHPVPGDSAGPVRRCGRRRGRKVAVVFNRNI
jgi:hypothetical protein